MGNLSDEPQGAGRDRQRGAQSRRCADQQLALIRARRRRARPISRAAHYFAHLGPVAGLTGMKARSPQRTKSEGSGTIRCANRMAGNRLRAWSGARLRRGDAPRRPRNFHFQSGCERAGAASPDRRRAYPRRRRRLSGGKVDRAGSHRAGRGSGRAGRCRRVLDDPRGERCSVPGWSRDDRDHQHLLYLVRQLVGRHHSEHL